MSDVSLPRGRGGTPLPRRPSQPDAPIRSSGYSYVPRNLPDGTREMMEGGIRRAPGGGYTAGGVTVGLGGATIGGPGAPRPGDLDSYVRTYWPYMGAFLGHPEVGPILRRAAAEGWDEGRLYGAVQATSWWQSTSAAQRTWQQLVNEDPAEAQRQAAQTAANMQNRARSLGLNMSSGTIAELATQATANGWTENQIVDELLRSVNWSTLQGGDLTALRDTVTAIGSQYLVDVSPSTAQQYAVAIASGEMTEAGVASIMQRQARDRFGWMADQIDAGVTPQQYFAPIRDVIARELEVAPETINLMDRKWLQMLEVPGQDGKIRGATLNEARLAARRDPMFADTSGAQEMMTKATAAIADTFGLRGV